MNSATWPAINEPVPSATFDLRPVFDLPQRECERDIEDLNQAVLDAWLAVLEPGAKLIALDWQHPSDWFDPHQAAALDQPWLLAPVPDGDYFIFVTPDLTQGTFGHPWEPSLCVFGRPLVDELLPALQDRLPTLRSRLVQRATLLGHPPDDVRPAALDAGLLRVAREAEHPRA